MEGALYNAMEHNEQRTTMVLPHTCTIASPANVALRAEKENASMQLFTTLTVPLVTSTHVSAVGHDAAGDAGFLVAFSPTGGNWAKLSFERTASKEHSIIATVARDGVVKKEASVAAKGHSVHLRMAVEEESTWFHWSSDGKQWHLVSKLPSVKADDVMYGFGVESPAGKGATYKFEFIVAIEGTVKDK